MLPAALRTTLPWSFMSVGINVLVQRQGAPYQVTVHTLHAQVWVGIHMPHGVESGLKGAIKRWRDAQTALLPGAELPSLIDAT